jgi:predicted nucleic-acid-binding protein
VLAIDTNMVVRLLTDDDPEQAAKARRLIETEAVFVASTVLLETEWVLRSAYGLDRSAVIRSLTAFVGLPLVKLEDPARMERALRRASSGMDFADALHLASAEGCEAFVTFDRRLEKAAAAEGPPVRLL